MTPNHRTGDPRGPCGSGSGGGYRRIRRGAARLRMTDWSVVRRPAPWKSHCLGTRPETRFRPMSVRWFLQLIGKSDAAQGSGFQNPSSPMAERVGFEPTIRGTVYTLSKRAPSAARPPLPGGHDHRPSRTRVNAGSGMNRPIGAGFRCFGDPSVGVGMFPAPATSRQFVYAGCAPAGNSSDGRKIRAMWSELTSAVDRRTAPTGCRTGSGRNARGPSDDAYHQANAHCDPVRGGNRNVRPEAGRLR